VVVDLPTLTEKDVDDLVGGGRPYGGDWWPFGGGAPGAALSPARGRRRAGRSSWPLEQRGRARRRHAKGSPAEPQYLPPFAPPPTPQKINWGVPNEIDLIAASFVRKGCDLDHIRSVLGEKGRYIKIISKVGAGGYLGRSGAGALAKGGAARPAARGAPPPGALAVAACPLPKSPLNPIPTIPTPHPT
jgi:hypothetical protein